MMVAAAGLQRDASWDSVVVVVDITLVDLVVVVVVCASNYNNNNKGGWINDGRGVYQYQVDQVDT
jgi:hypothetical protein